MGTGRSGRGGKGRTCGFVSLPPRPPLSWAGRVEGLGRQHCEPLHRSLLLRPACAPPPARSQLPWEWATLGTAPSLSPAGPHPRPAAAHAGICVTRPRVGGSRSGEWSKSGISRCDSARGGAGAAEVAGEGEGEAEGGAAAEAEGGCPGPPPPARPSERRRGGRGTERTPTTSLPPSMGAGASRPPQPPQEPGRAVVAERSAAAGRVGTGRASGRSGGGGHGRVARSGQRVLPGGGRGLGGEDALAGPRGVPAPRRPGTS